MRKLRRIAVGLIVLFALQAGGAILALASAPPCCPAMAGEPGDAAPPCRTVAAIGCCEELASGSLPSAAPPPVHALPVLAAALPRSASTAPAPSATCRGRAAARALRTTVLRL